MTGNDTVRLPDKPRGRPSSEWYNQLERFAEDLQQVDDRLDFKMSARGWAYYLENEGVIDKDQLDYAQKKVNQCRKRGLLPVEFTARDDAREFAHSPDRSPDPEGYLRQILSRTVDPDPAVPARFWETQDVFIQVLVEKVDLKELFAPTCRKYNIPIATAKGWSSIRQRASIARRFYKWRRGYGNRPVLLYCGDYDPPGVKISDELRNNLADLEDARIQNPFDSGYITGWTPDHVTIDRFGLNESFIDREGLTWIDNLKTSGDKDLADPGHTHHEQYNVPEWLDRHGARKVEANALVTRPEAGRQLFRETVKDHLGEDPDAARRRVREQQESAIKDRLSGLGLEKPIQEALSDLNRGGSA